MQGQVQDLTKYAALGGVKLELYAANAAGTAKKEPEEKLADEMIIKDDNDKPNVATPKYEFTLSSTNKYWMKVITPCGEVFEDLSNLDTNRKFKVSPKVVSYGGCEGDAETGMRITWLTYAAMQYPVTVTIKDRNNGTIVETQTITEEDNKKKEAFTAFKSKLLPFGGYDFQVTSVCPAYNSDWITAYNPKTIIHGGYPIGALRAVASFDLQNCNSENGIAYTTSQNERASVQLTLAGYVANEDKLNFTIKSGPSNVGVKAIKWRNRYRWFNVLPGDYVAEYTECGVTKTLPFTVDREKLEKENKLLKQEVHSTAISECNSSGRITSTIIFNKGTSDYMEIELLNENFKVIDHNKTGNFENLLPGTYYTRMKVEPYCNKMRPYYIENNQPLVITGNNGNPEIVSAQGIACEDLTTGALKPQGTIYLSLAAPAGVKLTYKKKGLVKKHGRPFPMPLKSKLKIFPQELTKFASMSVVNK